MPASNSRMTTIVGLGPEDYRVEDVASPTAGSNELVVRIGACGICARKYWSGADMFWGGKTTYVKPPVIPGHAFFGYVEELGPGAAEHLASSPVTR